MTASASNFKKIRLEKIRDSVVLNSIQTLGIMTTKGTTTAM